MRCREDAKMSVDQRPLVGCGAPMVIATSNRVFGLLPVGMATRRLWLPTNRLRKAPTSQRPLTISRLVSSRPATTWRGARATGPAHGLWAFALTYCSQDRSDVA
jgi:hypothetical protein